MGKPLGHTLSPAVHNAAFASCGINAVYLAFETLHPPGCREAARALPIKGLSVTIPYKSRILGHLDSVEATAAEIGAVNTVANRGGALHGFNTDAGAALKALEGRMDLERTSCLLLGAGGAARAVGFALRGRCAEITIANRTGDRAAELAGALGCRWTPLPDAAGVRAGLVINTTPVGMHPETGRSPVPVKALEYASVVMDIIYRPRRTALLNLAERVGCVTIAGEEMFLNQAAAQFSIWTGLEAPVLEMKTAFDQAVGGIK